MMEVREISMQQVQEKQPQPKVLSNHSTEQKPEGYRPSPLPFVLGASAKVCYGLSAASVIVSAGMWNRVRLPMPHLGKLSKKQPKASPKASPKQIRQARTQGALVSLFAPTFAVAGKLLDDAGERVARYDFAQWEKKQAEKARTGAFRFFSR